MVSFAKPNLPPGVEALQAATARRGLAGFFLSGLLLAFLGAILPAWSYHLREDYLTVGNYFLSMNLGLFLSIGLTQYVFPRKHGAANLALSAGIACASLFFLAFLPPASAPMWRMLGMAGVGTGAGLLNSGVFQAISPLYRHNPAATIVLSGIFFNFGCIVVSLLVAGTFYVYTVASILVFIAIIPGFFLGFYLKLLAAKPGFPEQVESKPGAAGTASWKDALLNMRSPAAVLLALLLFLQFGNEWSIAGWLPLFLSKRLGISPASSLLMLTLYWLALLVGRVAALAALPRLSHSKLLAASVLAALFGCTILVLTNNRFGAVTAILFIGAGFAPVYPLAVELIGGRFPSYHPGFFNGFFSFAVTGGLLAPWSLGFVAEKWGLAAIMALPLVGTLLVFVLVVLIWAEAKLNITS